MIKVAQVIPVQTVPMKQHLRDRLILMLLAWDSTIWRPQLSLQRIGGSNLLTTKPLEKHAVFSACSCSRQSSYKLPNSGHRQKVKMHHKWLHKQLLRTATSVSDAETLLAEVDTLNIFSGISGLTKQVWASKNIHHKHCSMFPKQPVCVTSLHLKMKIRMKATKANT